MLEFAKSTDKGGETMQMAALKPYFVGSIIGFDTKTCKPLLGRKARGREQWNSEVLSDGQAVPQSPSVESPVVALAGDEMRVWHFMPQLYDLLHQLVLCADGRGVLTSGTTRKKALEVHFRWSIDTQHHVLVMTDLEDVIPEATHPAAAEGLRHEVLYRVSTGDYSFDLQAPAVVDERDRVMRFSRKLEFRSAPLPTKYDGIILERNLMAIGMEPPCEWTEFYAQ